MRLKISTFLGAFTLFCAATAQAETVGSLGAGRTNAWLGDSSYSEITGVLTAGGHSLTYGNTIDAAFLGGIDVFFTSVFNPSTMPSGAALTAEVNALATWVQNGGTVIFSGEYGNPANTGSFSNAFNNYTQAFGITMGGVDSNTNTGVAFENNPADPYLANGVAGGSWAVNNRGWITSVSGSYTTLATAGLNPNELFAVTKKFGQGTVVAFADTYFMQNAADNDHTARQFLLNSIGSVRVMC